MPTTLVAVGVAALLAAALLGERAFTLRTLAVVVAAGAAPDLDALLWVVDSGLHNAALHNVWIPLATALVVRSNRGRAWLRDRYGPEAVHVAWVAIAAYAVAVAFDVFNVESAAVLWPVHDQFFAVVGKVAYSTTRGVEFTLLQPSLGGQLFPGASYGTVAGEYHVPSLFDPRGSDGSATRTAVAINAGWELLLVLAGAVVVGGRLRGSETTAPERSLRPAGEDD
jgi:hypothetical protein